MVETETLLKSERLMRWIENNELKKFGFELAF